VVWPWEDHNGFHRKTITDSTTSTLVPEHSRTFFSLRIRVLRGYQNGPRICSSSLINSFYLSYSCRKAARFFQRSLRNCVHAKMDVYHVYFSSKRGAPAQLVRGLRAGHEDVSAPDLSRYPVADDVTFLNPNTITLGQLQQLRQFFRRSPSFLSSKKSDDACAMRSVSSSQIGVLLIGVEFP
jgi:hypothetical protein